MRDFMIDAQNAYRSGQFMLALDLYNEEISMRPQNTQAYEGAARCLLILKRPVDSIAMCEKILELDHNYAIAHAVKAEAYHLLREFSKGNDEIRLAYSISPQNIEILISYGAFVLFDKKIDDAIALLEKAIQEDPNAYAAYHNLATAYEAKHNKAKVFFCVKEMYRLRPSVKNSIRLLIVYMNYTRLSIVLGVAYTLVLISFVFLQMWAILLLTGTLVVLFLIVIGRYLRT